MRSSLSFSPSSMRLTGMPVHLETTSATSSSVTRLRTSCWPCSPASAALRRFQLLLQLRNSPVLELRHTRARSAGALRGSPARGAPLQFFLDMGCAGHRGLLGAPDLIEVGVFLFQPGQLFLEIDQALLRGVVRFLLQRLALNLQLNDPPVQPIHRLRLGIDLHANARTRLVDQVDGLVRQLPVADVAMRQRCGRDDRRVGDFDAVVDFVAFFQAAQDRDRIFDRRFIDRYFLEAAFQRRVFLDITAGTRPAWSHRRSAARRGPAPVSACCRHPSRLRPCRHPPWCAVRR